MFHFCALAGHIFPVISVALMHCFFSDGKTFLSFSLNNETSEPFSIGSQPDWQLCKALYMMFTTQ